METVFLWVNEHKLRLTIQFATLASILLLFVSFNKVMVSWNALADVQYQVGQARTRTELLSKANQAAADQLRYQSERGILQQNLADAGFTPEDWTRRRLKVESAELHRKLVEVYISELKKREDFFFVPKEFVLRTVHTNEGLFSWRRGQSPNLHLSLEGDYYMRKPK
jgi:hypothetical protein